MDFRNEILGHDYSTHYRIKTHMVRKSASPTKNPTFSNLLPNLTSTNSNINQTRFRHLDPSIAPHQEIPPAFQQRSEISFTCQESLGTNSGLSVA